MLTLAMAPAIVGALAVTNLPAVASGLSTLSATGVGMPETHKVTEKTPDYNELKAAPREGEDKDPVFHTPEQMPSYPGGEIAMMNDLAQNIVYPESELNNPGVHRVILNFVIDTDGSISDITVLRSQGEAFDSAAIEALKKLKKFIPGKMEGKPVRVHYTLPVNFKISTDEAK